MHLLEAHLNILRLVLVLQLTTTCLALIPTCIMNAQPQNDFTYNIMVGAPVDMTHTVVPFTGCPASSDETKNYQLWRRGSSTGSYALIANKDGSLDGGKHTLIYSGNVLTGILISVNNNSLTGY